MPADWAALLFASLAVPRLPGTEPLERATEATVELLRFWGLDVQTEVFDTSARRLTAASLGAAGVGWVALLVAPLLVLPLAGWTVFLAALGGLALVGVIAHGIAQGYLPVGAPGVRVRNVVATRAAQPTLWLVAHLDSKSQRFSLRGRVIAVAAAAVGLIGFLVLLGVRLAGPVPWTAALPPVLLIAAGAAVLSRGSPGNASPGAVDNASGVIAALAAADALRLRTDVAVLLTNAEEFGMEGARAWCRSAARSGRFVNFDGLDGRGSYRVLRHGRAAAELARRIAQALADTGVPARPGPLPPGVLVDGAVLAEAGLAGVTVSRGDWQTLGAVHTARDTPERVDLAAVVDAGRAVARAVSAL